jgi:hypothetical protein
MNKFEIKCGPADVDNSGGSGGSQEDIENRKRGEWVLKNYSHYVQELEGEKENTSSYFELLRKVRGLSSEAIKCNPELKSKMKRIGTLISVASLSQNILALGTDSNNGPITMTRLSTFLSHEFPQNIFDEVDRYYPQKDELITELSVLLAHVYEFSRPGMSVGFYQIADEDKYKEEINRLESISDKWTNSDYRDNTPEEEGKLLELVKKIIEKYKNRCSKDAILEMLNSIMNSFKEMANS